MRDRKHSLLLYPSQSRRAMEIVYSEDRRMNQGTIPTIVLLIRNVVRARDSVSFPAQPELPKVRGPSMGTTGRLSITTTMIYVYIIQRLYNFTALTSRLSIPTRSEILSSTTNTNTMTSLSQLKALFFDVFGTCVDWRKTVTEALIDAAKQAGDTTMAIPSKNNTGNHMANPLLTVFCRLVHVRPTMAQLLPDLHPFRRLRPISNMENRRPTPPRLSNRATSFSQPLQTLV